MQFENPYVFLLVPVLISIIWIFLRQRTDIGFSTFKLLGLGKPREVAFERVQTIPLDLLQKILLAIAVIAIVAAIAGPFEEIVEPIPTYHEGRDLVILLDVSGSMGTQYREVEKLDTAIGVVRAFVEARSYDRICLFSFETQPQLEWPLAFAEETSGLHDPILVKLDELDTNGGTNIAAALLAALDHLGILGEAESRVIILVSDGVSTIGKEDNDEIISRIEGGGIHLYWILIDTIAQTTPTSIPTSASTATVTRLIEKVEGKVFKSDPQDLTDAFAEIGRLETSPVTYKEKVERIYLFRPFVLSALGLLLAATIVELVKEVC